MNSKSITSHGLAVLLSCMLLSCATPNISYLSDVPGDVVFNDNPQLVKVQVGDKISIIAKSKDPQLSELFNLSIMSNRVGSTRSASDGSQQLACYSVTSDGCIDFPVLGKVKVAGKTREQIAEVIKQRLISENLVKDPVITVEFENLHYSVIGEVKSPGQYSIDRDNISLLDALSKAGDLTIYGRRNNVLVIRQQDGKRKTYRVDLTDAYSIINSPAAYLQQNDIVYVDPNDVRKRQSTVNGNNVLSASFWVSIASLLTSIAVLIAK